MAIGNIFPSSFSWVGFWSITAKWEIQNNFDYVQFEVSTDNGNNWVPQCGTYTQIGGPNHQNAYNEPIYTGNQYSWVQEKVSLSDYLEETILVRFKIVTNNFGRRDGFYFDDFEINGISNQLSIENNIKENTYLYPNPVDNLLNINTTFNDYSIEIYSISGQLMSRSKNIKTFDFSNFSSGIYLLKLITGKKSKIFKVLK